MFSRHAAGDMGWLNRRRPSHWMDNRDTIEPGHYWQENAGFDAPTRPCGDCEMVTLTRFIHHIYRYHRVGCAYPVVPWKTWRSDHESLTTLKEDWSKL